ncbi:pre-peptidase C-terminal domain-containing protein [Leptolyngbya sp. FACHB-541]|uniref:pre-peptidase C-terminal domain-containing protein n=1 Tax=Leptolyngbya sp. FACHB-541 TaxID=2692810 RepID=UPI0016822C60|nr:pre-peptidase C-terminal domain-containing protein [Leptolyngbya sp. FACHB-541]MBD2000296.1 pre-peptidase C-terminal domain-containing protein [Leptolyngbya sp. FACHB-541]
MSTSNLGTLRSTPRSKNDSTLTTSDPTDVYKFRLTGTSNINLSLNEISFGDDADLRLYRDSNRNGRLDIRNGVVLDEEIASSVNSSNLDDAINVRANAGTYFARVERYALGSSGTVTYDLDLSATSPSPTASPSNLLPKEFTVGHAGTVVRDQTYSDAVGDSDTADVYSFKLSRNYRLDSINLSGLSDDADIRVIQDRNRNRIVDEGEVIASSTNGGSSMDSISAGQLRTGVNYFLQVYQYSGNTDYQLTFDVA